MAEQPLRLLFDSELRYGSKEHYFHFLWGYLLPAVREIYRSRTDTPKYHYLFESCGPVMDRVTEEVIALFALNARISSLHCTLEQNAAATVLPRWDIYLLRDFVLGLEVAPYSRMSKRTFRQRLLRDLMRPEFVKGFRADLSCIRSLFLAHVRCGETDLKQADKGRKYYVLARSSMPDFYAQHGQAKIKGYGTSRRSLQGISAFIERFNNPALNLARYEPGKQTLVHQIRTFSSASGVIGIKGAEFANLLWAPKDCRVIMIRPSKMLTAPVQGKLASLLGLEFSELVVPGDGHLNLMDMEFGEIFT